MYSSTYVCSFMFDVWCQSLDSLESFCSYSACSSIINRRLLNRYMNPEFNLCLLLSSIVNIYFWIVRRDDLWVRGSLPRPITPRIKDDMGIEREVAIVMTWLSNLAMLSTRLISTLLIEGTQPNHYEFSEFTYYSGKAYLYLLKI